MLAELEFFINQIIAFLSPFMPIVALIAITVNIFHVAILSRSTMTSSSMNTLLIGIAIVDILSPLLYLKWGIVRVIYYFSDPDECSTSAFIEVLIELLLMALNDDFRRCSTWLGLLLVGVRTVSVKMATKRNLHSILESKFGWKLIWGTVVCSSLIVIPYFLRWQIAHKDEHFCITKSGEPYLTSTFLIQESKGNEDAGGIGRTVHLITTAFLSKLIPCILFPIFAITLMCALEKYDESTRTAKSEKINMITVFMTISFLSVELPVGIFKVLMLFEPSLTLLTNLKRVFDFLYVPMTATHAFICFSMSSQYRRTVYKVLSVQPKLSVAVVKISAASSRIRKISIR